MENHAKITVWPHGGTACAFRDSGNIIRKGTGRLKHGAAPIYAASSKYFAGA